MTLADAMSKIKKRIASDAAPALFSLTIRTEAIDPLAGLEMLQDPLAYQYYWERPEQGLAIAGGESALTLTTHGTERFEQIGQSVASCLRRSVTCNALEHSMAGPHFLGGFSFFDHPHKDHWKDFDASNFTVPRWMLIRDGKLGLLTLSRQVNAATDPEVLYDDLLQQAEHITRKLASYSPERLQARNGTTSGSLQIMPATRAYQQWVDGVENARDLIRHGRFEKIVLARQLDIEADHALSPTLALNRLRRHYPDCYTFMVKPASGAAFLGCTPERLASFKPGCVLTEGLAGSIPRGESASEDALLERELLNSEKNLKEHRFVVKALEERLAPYASRIECPESPGIKKLSNVQHLHTPITAWLKDTVEPAKILSRLHPTPAVGGFPKESALPFIRKLEHFDRGWYAGPVGWLNAGGGGEFAVAIRSGLMEARRARFFAGCGIVEDSDPRSEWEETKLKFMPMISAIEHA